LQQKVQSKFAAYGKDHQSQQNPELFRLHLDPDARPDLRPYDPADQKKNG
jgi:hypothetical protein